MNVGEHMRRERDPGRFARVDERTSAAQPAHTGEVKSDHVNGATLNQRFRVVAASLLVTHRDRGATSPSFQLSHNLRVPWRKHIFKPAEPHSTNVVHKS